MTRARRTTSATVGSAQASRCATTRAATSTPRAVWTSRLRLSRPVARTPVVAAKAGRCAVGGATPGSVGDDARGGAAIDVDAGDRHTGVVRAGGDVLCWGDGERGKLGYGNTESIGDGETAASVGAIELGGSARQVVTGYNHTCA